MFENEKYGHGHDSQILPHMFAQPAQEKATKEHLFEDGHQEAPTSNCDDQSGRRLPLEAGCIRCGRDNLPRNTGEAAEDRFKAVVEENNNDNGRDEYADTCRQRFRASEAQRDRRLIRGPEE